MLPKIKAKRYNTRSTDEYENFPRPNEKYYKSFFPHFTRSWNNLDKEIREDGDHHNFKEQIKIRLEPPRHPHYKYGDKYANNSINFFFLLNQFLKIQVIEAMPSYFCSWPNKILQNHLFIPVEAIKSKIYYDPLRFGWASWYWEDHLLTILDRRGNWASWCLHHSNWSTEDSSSGSSWKDLYSLWN